MNKKKKIGDCFCKKKKKKKNWRLFLQKKKKRKKNCQFSCLAKNIKYLKQ